MRYLILALASCAFLASNKCLAKVVIKETSNSGGIRVGGDRGDGQLSEFYATGNASAIGDFREYGILGFTFDSMSDFGFDSMSGSDILSVQLSLTVNDRAFSSGGAIEFFFTSDTFASLGDGSSYSDLTYDTSVVNGLDPTQYGMSPLSLGIYSLPEMEGREGGDVDIFTLDFSDDSLDALLASINAGDDFQIIGGATDPEHEITYSGFENTFDPGNPILSITAVPEPGAFSLLSILASATLIGCRRRL